MGNRHPSMKQNIARSTQVVTSAMVANNKLVSFSAFQHGLHMFFHKALSLMKH